MVVFWGVTIIFVGLANSQQYGPPNYTPGIPIGTPGQNDIVRAHGYDASPPGQNYGAPDQGNAAQNYGVPDQGNGAQNYGPPSSSGFGSASPVSSSSYGAPSSGFGSSSSYGPPSSGGSRFRIIPANEFQIPQQHSNLIRYIVLKEFQIGANGSATPLNVGLGRNNGSPELEITRMQLPSSAEMASAGASANSGENSGAEVGGYSDGPGGYADTTKPNEDDDDYDDDEDDYDEEDDVEDGGNSSARDAVVPARGVDLPTNKATTSLSNAKQSAAMEAFMFSDPNSNSIEAQRKQGTGPRRNRVRNGNRNRNRIPGQRNRNRNRNRLNRNRNRNRNRNQMSNSAMSSAAAAAGAAAAAASSSEDTPPAAELQMALQTLSKYFTSQAQQMRAQMGGAAPSSMVTAPGTTGAGGSTYTNIPITSGGPYAPSGGVSSASAFANSMGTSADQSNPPVPDATVIDPDTPPATQATFPASTYGPPPGSFGFGGSNGGNSIVDAITGPITKAAGFKSAVINGVASGLTAGIRGVAAATSAVTKSVGNVADAVGSQGGGFIGGGSSGGVSDLAPVYGAPTFGSSGSISPLRQLVGLKGQAVRTVANSGRAAVGIVGTKGQLVVNQVGTVATTLTKGVAQALNNNNDAFQNVIRHIQSIFNTNANMKNNAYGAW